MDPNIIDTALEILQWILTVIGAASAIVAALMPIAKLTPTSKDDEILSGAQKFLAQLIAVLDRLAMNPDQNKARKPKQ